MAMIKLGATPKNFKKTVKVQMLDGTTGTIDCTFIYRTVTEYGELIDKLNEDGATPKDADEAFSLASLFARNKTKNGAYLLQILEGWGMDSEFNPETAQRLCDEYPGVGAAIFETYRNAIVEGRLGN